MRSWIEVVSPKEAERYLAANTRNRNLKETVVERYARDMEEGKWEQPGFDAIAFNCDGRLINGQHRLAAVVQSGATLSFLMVDGIDVASQLTGDAGVKRSFADFLKMEGYGSYTNEISALTRAMFEWDMGYRRNRAMDPGKHATPSELLEYFKDHEHAICKTAPRAMRVKDHVLAPGSLIGMLWMVFERIDDVDADEFWAQMKTGRSDTSNALELLHKALINNKMSKQSNMSRPHMTAIIIKAWNAWRDGQDVGILTYRPGGASREGFPQPR